MTPFQLFIARGIIRRLPEEESQSCLFLLEYRHCSMSDTELIGFTAMRRSQREEIEIGDFVEVSFVIRGEPVNEQTLEKEWITIHFLAHSIEKLEDDE